MQGQQDRCHPAWDDGSRWTSGLGLGDRGQCERLLMLRQEWSRWRIGTFSGCSGRGWAGRSLMLELCLRGGSLRGTRVRHRCLRACRAGAATMSVSC